MGTNGKCYRLLWCDDPSHRHTLALSLTLEPSVWNHSAWEWCFTITEWAEWACSTATAVTLTLGGHYFQHIWITEDTRARPLRETLLWRRGVEVEQFFMNHSLTWDLGVIVFYLELVEVTGLNGCGTSVAVTKIVCCVVFSIIVRGAVSVSLMSVTDYSHYIIPLASWCCVWCYDGFILIRGTLGLQLW